MKVMYINLFFQYVYNYVMKLKSNKEEKRKKNTYIISKAEK